SASLGGETLVSSLSQTLFFLLKWTLLGLAAAALVLWLRPQAPALQATPQESSAQDKPVVDASRAVVPLSVHTFADAARRASTAMVNTYTARVVSSVSRSDSTGNTLLSQKLPNVRGSVDGSPPPSVTLAQAGHLITKHHVIQGSDHIRVQLA